MSNQNQTSELEYCETCGTMLVMGNCRRCNPVTKTTTKSKSSYRKSIIPKGEIHSMSVDYIIDKLIDQGIITCHNVERGIDLTLNNGKTITCRGLNEEIRDPVTAGSIDNLKSDYVILVTNLKYTSIKRIYIMPTEIVKSFAKLDITKDDGLNTYFIKVSEYSKYKDNYSILIN